MMQIYRRTLLVFILIPLFGLSAKAQTADCLREAQTQYDQGLLIDIPATLQTCLEDRNGITIREERIQAYKLLTNVYIYLDDIKSARQNIIKLLKVDPEHEPEEDDPAEFKYLYYKYSSDPIFAAVVNVGSVFSSVRVQEAYLLGDINQSTVNYTTKPSIVAGAGAEYRFHPNFQVGAGLRFAQKSYNYLGSLVTLGQSIDLETTPTATTNFNEISFTETQTTLDIPVYFKANYKPGQFVPYAYAGFEINYMLRSEMIDLARTSELVASDNSAPIAIFEPGVRVNDVAVAKEEQLREQINVSLLGGLGLKYRVNRIDFLFVDFAYSYGLTNFVNQEARYENFRPELQNEFLYVDSDLKMSSVLLTFGYVKSFYRTKNLDGSKSEKSKKKK